MKWCRLVCSVPCEVNHITNELWCTGYQRMLFVAELMKTKLCVKYHKYPHIVLERLLICISAYSKTMFYRCLLVFNLIGWRIIPEHVVTKLEWHVSGSWRTERMWVEDEGEHRYFKVEWRARTFKFQTMLWVHVWNQPTANQYITIVRHIH